MSDPHSGRLAEGTREGTRVDRRRFLQGAMGAGAAGLLGAMAGGAGATTRNHEPARSRRAGHGEGVAMVALAGGGPAVPTARWVLEENRRPGTIDWIVAGVQVPHAIEGYASHVSAVAGEDVTLFVNTAARSVSVQAFRMGYYQGLGGRLVDQSETVAGQTQAPPSFAPGINTVFCEWQPTVTMRVRDSWPPGCYLLKLVGDGGQQQYVPLTVRDDASTAAFVVQNSVTTWQAYNRWGGYSLYYGVAPGGGSDFADRARIVSFDRPYPKTWAQGSADFLGNEYPLVYQMERLGLDLTFWTDIDLHERPRLLANHRCLISLGHDEYWSAQMRQGAQGALGSGTNLAFLGANACYRQIRLQPSPVGPNRQQICYKDASEDPIAARDPALTTVNWPQPPVNRPECELIGSMYQSVGADDPLVITDASSWLFKGCGFSDGQALPGVVQGEFDRYVPALPGPRNADVLAHSPVAGQGNWSDITYYTAGGRGGGVVAVGMASFVNKLSDTTAFPSNVVPAAIPGVTQPLLRMMENLYGALGVSAASVTRPSTGNWTSIYQGSAAAQGSAQPANSA